MVRQPARLSTPQGLLHRILHEEELVHAVQKLDPHVLGGLVARVGLEDAGELLALATTQQLNTLLDDDLWHPGALGEQEAFDPRRFGLWLAVLAEAGDALLLRKLTELDEDLLVLGLCHNVLVLDLDAALSGVAMGEDPEPVEQALEDSLNLELENYVVLCRDPQTWDAVVNALTLLDTHEHHVLQTLLRRCQRAGEKHVEDHGGLLEVLGAQEELLSDVLGERNDRREERGFVSAQNAAAFLGLARLATLETLLAHPSTVDPITRSYERSVETARKVPFPSGEDPAALRLTRLLRDAEDEETPGRGRRALAESAGPPVHALMRQALQELHTQGAAAHARCLSQLTYLANVVMVGCELQGRAPRPQEAAEAAMATCNLGLDEALSTGGKESPGDVLARVGAVNLFMAGMGTLQREVCVALARAVLAALPARHPGRPALRLAVSKGQPWTALSHLELPPPRWDPAAWEDLRRLLGGLPCSSAGFISTRAQRLAVVQRALSFRRD
jgi:hypothetical protein